MLSRTKSFGNELVFLSLVIPLVLAESLGHACDILTTYIALTYCGAREMNPFLAPLLNSEWRFKWVTVSAIKGALLTNSFRWHLTANSEWKRRYSLRTAIFSAVLIWAVVAWNFSVILRRKRANTST